MTMILNYKFIYLKLNSWFVDIKSKIMYEWNIELKDQ